jgi:hypothetical protein
LLHELYDTEKYVLDFKTGPDNDVTHLFLTHRIFIDLVRRFGSVLVMDCTYKANKFRMPLLQVVGVTSFWTTFFCCFVFLAEEKDDDCEWALGAIRQYMYGGEQYPVTIPTDCERALLNSIRTVFSQHQSGTLIVAYQQEYFGKVQAFIQQ